MRKRTGVAKKKEENEEDSITDIPYACRHQYLKGKPCPAKRSLS
jgi:hypothetical protein